MNNFTHLNLHSEYSLIDGIIKIGQIISLYKEYNINSICITDLVSVCSFYEYYYYCIFNNIKPLIGTECFLIENNKILGCILLAKNYFGYLDLINLISNLWRYGNVSNGVFIKKHWLLNYCKNLIIIINLRSYLLNEDFSEKEFFSLIKNLLNMFGEDIYLEINKINLPLEDYINEKILNYSLLFKIKIVATNSVKFLFKEDYTASIGKILSMQNKEVDSELYFDYTNQQYLTSFIEFKKKFLNNEFIFNIGEIVDKCNLNFKAYGFNLPYINIKKFQIRKKIFNNLLKKGLKNRILKKKKKIFSYLDRINKEIILVKKLGLIDYFLIIIEFIFWTKKQGIFSGPGRGSGASSLICYSLYITDIDPINENLLFERFLTSERIGMPDLDLDFCVLERDSIIEHMFEYYDYSNTSQIITFNTLSAKSSIRDLSRAIGLDYTSGDRFCKCIPFSVILSMEDIFRENLSVRSYIAGNETSMDVWKISTKTEGIYKNISKHAGGVVISKNGLFNSSPIILDDDDCVTQYEKIILQDIGLIKFDFLGLKTLSIIGINLKLIPEKSTGEFIIDDYQTYQMINNLETDLVFQLESYGMRKLISKSPIENIFDLILYLSLFRPGPIQSGCVNTFLNRKNNLSETFFPYEYCNYSFLKVFIGYTHGVILFQEQIILMINYFFESTMFDSEKIFSIMLNSSSKELDICKKIFIKKCDNFSLDKKKIETLFELIVRFASYSFNRTHAHSYSKIVFQTAYLKANYLIEFCLSNIYVEQLLGLDLDKIILDLKKIGIIFYKPDINLSDENFKSYKKGILYGFSIVNHIDYYFIDRILYYRNKIFYYNSFELFCKIFSIFKINNKSIIDDLIFCGFFDCFRINRSILFINFQFIYEKINSLSKEYNRSILYKFINYIDYSKIDEVIFKMLKILPMDLLRIEKKMLKFFISSHPGEISLNKFLGHYKFNCISRIEKNILNISSATVKKKTFFERKSNIFKIFNNEKIFNFFRYSKYVVLPNNETAYVFAIKYNNKKNRNEILKCFSLRIFKNSIGTIILIFIKNIFLFYKIIKLFFNLFTWNGDLLYIYIKKKIFKINFSMKFNDYCISVLKYFGIKHYSVIMTCK